MSETHGRCNKEPAAVEKIEKTRRAIEAHRALPLGQRVIRRLTANYPSWDDRQQLAEYDRPAMEKFKRIAGSRTHTAGFFTSRPPFMDDENGKYQEMQRSSQWFYTSRYLTVRCNPVVREVIAAAEDRRAQEPENRVEEPWYAGLFRQVLPAKGFFGHQQEHIGIFLTDKAGVEFETIEIDETLMDSLPEQTQRDLGDFAYGIPGLDPRLTATAP